MIESLNELRNSFDEYLSQYPEYVKTALKGYLDRKGPKADRWIAERFISLEVPLGEDLRHEIFSEVEVVNTGLGSTPKSELRKYINRKNAQSQMVNRRKSMSTKY